MYIFYFSSFYYRVLLYDFYIKYTTPQQGA